MPRSRFAPLAIVALALTLAGCGLLLPARLSVSPTSVVLGSFELDAQFTVANAGAYGSLLRWRFVSDELEAMPVSGTLASGTSVDVRVFAPATAVSRTYQGAFVAGRQQVAVTVTVLGSSALTCDPESAFEAAAATATARVLVGYDDTAVARASRADLSTAAMAVTTPFGGVRTRAGSGRGFDVVEVPRADLDAALAALRATPGVRYAEVDAPVFRSAAPADAVFGEQWNLSLFGAEAAWTVVDALAPEPHGVVVAVVDDGVAVDHPDLAGRLWPGVDVVGRDLDVRNCTDHGTHVAGIIGAAREPSGPAVAGTGVAGVASAPWVRVLPVKAWPDTASPGADTSVSFVVDAMRWAAGEDVPGLPRNEAHPADVVNLSLGTDFASNALADAVADLVDAGIVVVAAAGNDGSAAGVDYPARSPGALAVGSVNANRMRSTFSNYGIGLDLMAPGGRGPNARCGDAAITSTGITYASSLATETWTCKDGTSMATPFVAGAAALLIGTDPDVRAASGAARVALVEQRLLEAAARVPGANTAEYGAGVLCLDALLTATHVCGDEVAGP